MLNYFKVKIGNFLFKSSEIHLQAKLSELIAFPENHDFILRQIDINCPDDLNKWIELVNDAYGLNYDTIDAEKNIKHHSFLEETETYIYFDQFGIAVATVSIGIYKENPKFGGVFRLAVKKIYQNKGLGKLIILTGYKMLHEKGIEYGESVVSHFRQKSILVHMYCGFKPIWSQKKIVHKSSNYNKTIILRLKGIYAIYKANKIFNTYAKDK